MLKSGFATGRLTKDEYDDHLHQVYTARTHGDLAQVTGQLPGGGMALFRAPAPVVKGTNSLAVAALVCGVAEFFTARADRDPGGDPRPHGARPDPADR